MQKIDSVRLDILQHDLDILCLSETWLHENIPDAFITADGYEIVRLDRDRKKGGGLCMFIKDSITYDQNIFKDLNLSDKNIEIQLVVIKSDNARSMIIANCYRPPNGSIERAVESLKLHLSMVPDVHKFEIVIAGDLNLDCSDSTLHSAKCVSSICFEFSLTNMITLPTRFSGSKWSILDVMLTNIRNCFISGVVNYNISDHLPIVLVKKRVKIRHSKVTSTGRSYKNYNREMFMTNLSQLDWSILYLLDDPEKAWNMVLKAIIYEADIQCPIKKFKVKTSRPEWLSLELIEMARDRDVFARLAKRKNDAEHWQIFRGKRNEYNACLKRAKNDYIVEQLNRYQNDQKKFWENVKDILPNRTGKHVGQVKDPCSQELLSPSDSVNAINTFFSEYGKKLCESLPNCPRPYEPAEVNHCLTEFQPVTTEKVMNLINSIKLYKSSGIRDISSRLLKDGLSALPEQI